MATLLDDISSLSEAEKVELLDAIWEDLESQPPTLSAEQAKELDHRIEIDERNPSSRHPLAAGKGCTAQAVISVPVLWTDEVKMDFCEAEEWYAGIGLQLSDRFVQAVEDAVRLIEEFPDRFPLIYRERRRAGVRTPCGRGSGEDQAGCGPNCKSVPRDAH